MICQILRWPQTRFPQEKNHNYEASMFCVVKMRFVVLISGGIDSPVAAYLMLKKGIDLVAVHLDNRPFTDDKEYGKMLSLIEHLSDICDKDIRIVQVPHKDHQLAFSRNCNRHLQCVLCKRMMLRIGERVAVMEGAKAIVTGESLGQVASQTMENLRVENQTVKIPVLRPLIGFDKEEIISIAKAIGTYEISIRPGVCCNIVPKKPSTRANLEQVLREEEKIDIPSLVETSIESRVVR